MEATTETRVGYAPSISHFGKSLRTHSRGLLETSFECLVVRLLLSVVRVSSQSVQTPLGAGSEYQCCRVGPATLLN